MNDIELLSPAGSFETALAAFAAGADAVYLGLDAFSARAEAVNLTVEQLRLLLAHARALPQPRKVYVTFNTLVDDAQLPAALEKLALLEDLGPDGLIVQDLGIARLVRQHFPRLPLHASTQLVTHNLEGALALRDMGFVRVVLARELPLEDIRTIARRSGLEIEVFVHGALCYSISGLCLFSAMEKGRSGNRGQCAYCCRLGYTDAAGGKSLPFSMKDLRLDDRLGDLKEAGVCSLKIEGRMKSALYVSSVTRHYRELLDTGHTATTRADLETVFSRRTTALYLDGYPPSPASRATAPAVIDPTSLGHLGTPVGTVKRLTKDREGRLWMRFHTNRALERHDGLQFAAPEGGKPLGFGIGDMRTALSRQGAFDVRAGEDVEVRVPAEPEVIAALTPGATVYCSASNAVKRRFPAPPFRAGGLAAGTPVDITVTLAQDGVTARSGTCRVHVARSLSPAEHPERTFAAVEKCFNRLGESNWRCARLVVEDPQHLFAPASLLNDVRRRLTANLDENAENRRREKVARLLEAVPVVPPEADGTQKPFRSVKVRSGQPLPQGNWDETILALEAGDEPALSPSPGVRLALPIFTKESAFARLRTYVKGLVHRGYRQWEAADLATLRLLRGCGVTDVTADWSLYAFNRAALAQLAEAGVRRCVCSPENQAANLEDLARYVRAARADTASFPLPEIEIIRRQATPLFISLTPPFAEDPAHLTGLRGDRLVTYLRGDLWITIREEARTFPAVPFAAERTDMSWDAP